MEIQLHLPAITTCCGRLAHGLAVAVLLLQSSTASAQAQGTRYWLSGAIAIGRSGPAQSLGQDQYQGPGAELAGGIALTGRGLIGLTGAFWRQSTPIGSSRSAFVVASLTAYPFDRGLDDFYIEGGLGVGNGSFPTSRVTGGPSRIEVTRPALMVGLGYDMPLRCPLWIGPFAQIFNTVGGRRITVSGTDQSIATANAVLFQVGVSVRLFHPGPRGSCSRRGSPTVQ